MPKIVTEALCIRAEDYGENGKILTLFTTDSGKITAGIKGVKSPKSKLKSGATAPAFAEYELLSQNGNRYTVTGVNLKDGFFSCWQNLEKFAATEVILEFADRFTSSDGSVAEELVLTLRALSEVNYGEHTPFIVSVWYFLHIAGAAGVDFHDETELPGRVMGNFEAIASAEPEELGSLELSPSELVELLRYISLISAVIFGTEMKSLKEALKLIVRN